MITQGLAAGPFPFHLIPVLFVIVNTLTMGLFNNLSINSSSADFLCYNLLSTYKIAFNNVKEWYYQTFPSKLLL